MSKNLTRKGLALGAIVALGSSLFAGAPAFAGVESAGVTLVANAGDTFTSISGAKFDLSTVVATSIVPAADRDKLSYLITNSAEEAIKVGFDGAVAGTADDHQIKTGTSATTLGTTGPGTDATELTAKSILVLPAASGNVNTTSASVLTNHLFVTTSADATDNVVLTVQAFIDENGDGKIGEFDLTSKARTLTFIPAANVTATSAITSAVIGSSELAATVTLGNDINMANLPADAINIQVKKNGTTVAKFKPIGAAVEETAVSYDATDKVLTNLLTDTELAITADVYIVQAYFGTVAGAVKLGAASNAVAPANGTVTSVDAVDAVAVTVSPNSLADGTVRSGYTGDVTFTSKALAGTTVVKIAGIKVKVSVSGTLAAASTFVAGGKTLTATSGAVSFETTTDAAGKISFTGAGTGKAGDTVTVTVSALKSANGYTNTESATIIYTAAAVASTLKQTSLIGASAVAKATLGGNVKLSYSLVDQFGQVVTDGTYRASVSTSDSRNTGTQINASALVTAVAGKFDVSLTDNSTKAGNYDVNLTVYKYDTVASAWKTVSTATGSTIVYVNAVVPATLTASEPIAAVATTTTKVSALDRRVDAVATEALDWGTAKHTIAGYVSDATGARVAGAVVTVTGAGYGFYTENVWTVGSAIINADASGAYTVDVYSNAAGKGSVVVTSGAATKTVAVEYTGVTTLDAKGTITLDVPALSQVGRSVTVGILVKDSLGNAVKSTDLISVSVTGIGSLSASKVSTDADGKATVQFVAGANDFGDAVIVAKYTNADDTVVSATKTITVGISDSEIDNAGKRVTAVASFTKGKTVSFYVDGVKKWSKRSTSDADVVVYYNLKKGKHTVAMKISGGLVNSEVIIVK